MEWGQRRTQEKKVEAESAVGESSVVSGCVLTETENHLPHPSSYRQWDVWPAARSEAKSHVIHIVQLGIGPVGGVSVLDESSQTATEEERGETLSPVAGNRGWSIINLMRAIRELGRTGAPQAVSFHVKITSNSKLTHMDNWKMLHLHLRNLLNIIVITLKCQVEHINRKLFKKWCGKPQC